MAREYLIEARQEWKSMRGAPGKPYIGNPYHQLRRINECLDALGADYSVLEEGVSNDAMFETLRTTFEQRKIGHYEAPYKGDSWFVKPRDATSASSATPQSETPTPAIETRSIAGRNAYGSDPKDRAR